MPNEAASLSLASRSKSAAGSVIELTLKSFNSSRNSMNVRY